jgi:membrane associated rhomboid family serine protease
MAGGRRRRADLQRILTLGDTVPRSVGGILIAMLVSTVATMTSRALWGLLSLDGPAIFSGQLWRLVTWVFPQGEPLTLLFVGFALYWLGRDLANTWSERRFLQVFFGHAAWAAFWTALIAAIWAGADRPYMGAWPVVNGLMVGWGLSRPGAQISLFGVVPMSGKVFAWLVVGGTVLYALSSPAAGEYVPHFAAIVLALLMNAGITPRRTWLRVKEQWFKARIKRRMSHLRPVPRNDDKPTWMN